jgi:hypothetical protein
MNKPHHESLGSLFESLLKSPAKLINSFSQTDKPGAIIAKLLLLSLGGFLIFGITLGSFSFHEQLWAAPLKTLLGISLSSIICLPSLYVFSALTGTSLGVKEIVQGMAGSLALVASLLLGFTPVLWVFSQSTTSEGFFGFLVLATWLIALFFGTGFLLKMLAQTGTTRSGPLRIWIGIFLLVTLQMATTLRPLIGRSDSFFTSEKLFFLEHWGMTVSENRSTEYREPETQPITPESPQTTPHGNSQTNPFLDE